MEKGAKISLAFLAILFVLVIIILIIEVIATGSGSSDNANLTIWDDSDSIVKYTYCSGYCTEKIKSSSTFWNIRFYSNYTNSSGSAINLTYGNGNCTIKFNETGTWTIWNNMSYNATSFLWQYNRSFNYKGTLNFSVNCTSDYGNITISDSIIITNTEPYIIKTAAGYIDFDGDGAKDILQCTEDILCYYNFSANVSEDDLNDVLTFDYSSATNTTLTNFTINSTTGMLGINITLDANAGSKKIELTVQDTESTTKSGILEVNITTVNDAPVFVGLQNFSFNMSELFERIINVTDEENNIPFVLNITFLNCSVAQWSTRNCSNSTGRELFNSSQYTFNQTSGRLNISFIPLRNDVGYYIINFSVMDNSSLGNKTTSQIVNFTVLNVNVAPYFTYVCDNERNTTEDLAFGCWINATDIDETNNLTFTANYSWFKFNSSNTINISWSVSSDYNFSARVNFTPTDTEVGNWSVNITLTDTGGLTGPIKSNSTIIWFFINNSEDLPTLNEIANQTLYENRTIYVNATDNDLLVPDKNVKNEILSFASNTSWVNVSTFSAPINVNYTTARIKIDYNTALNNFGVGNYTVKINVTDTAGNFAERIFTIRILNDTPATWNSSKQYNFSIYENNNTYINLSEYVSDVENDVITFSFTNDTAFPSFNLNSSTGVINFTPIDEDVGQHIVTINASDGKLDSFKTFNFTIYNINDAPYIEKPIQQSNVINASVDANSNINATEDNVTTIIIWVRDDDFKIPSGQKSFYNENLTINLTIIGPNITLFRFVIDSAWDPPIGNKTKYDATFTPRKLDVGSYNITINVTDNGNVTIGGMKSDFLSFNLTISAINHAPILMNLTNHTSAINRSFYYRINATDIEDGNSTTIGNRNFTFSYNFTYGINIFNVSIFNSTTGEINITFNSSQGGKYRITITVNDTQGAEDSDNFWLYVYDYPNITFPASNYIFNLTENVTSNLTFQLNHSVQDNLTYEFYIGDGNATLKYNISYYGNNSNLTWQFTPNFTDETYGSFKNLTLIVYPLNEQLANRTAINTTIKWNINISHRNAPVIFSGYIGKHQANYDQVITTALATYFSDVDHSDSRYNQTVNFTITSNATPSYISASVANWILTLSSLIAVTELITINASDVNISNSSQTLTSATSNSFEVEFTPPTTTPTPTSGGGGATIPLSLKIILPEPISAYKKDKIQLPIVLVNNGKTNLYGINLNSFIAKNNALRKDITLSFDKNYFSSLLVNERKNVTLTAIIDTEELGLYELTINASVESPKYSDWGKLYLTVKEANKTEILETIVFTEEFIAKNPECIEIKEIVKEARKSYENGNYKEALEKAEEAINACRASIAQPALPILKIGRGNELYKYLSLSALGIFVVGFLYYIYRKIKFRRGLA